MLPLFELFPGTAALRRAGIADLPTPVDSAEALLRSLAAENPPADVAIKRDDLTSTRYGGNKVRKLDLLLGDAREREARAVITFGAYGSNHALATAVHARALGLEPHVVLSPQEPSPFAPRTLLAHAALGTVIHLVDGWDGRRAAVRAKQALVARDGIEPYVIPMGGTCPLGAVGYVNAALEVVAQAAPDVVYVAAGTLGTAIGLALGFALAGAPTRVEAVRVTPLEICNESIAEDLARDTLALLRSLDDAVPSLTMADFAFTLRHDHFDPGYGIPTPEALEAVAFAENVGLHLETTYTGKALSALIADARAGLVAGESALFWDTYNSAPYPAAGDLSALPEPLRAYVAECRELFPDSP